MWGGGLNALAWGGIIAAGEGSRLASAFPGVPKPLVRVAGRALIDWAVAAQRAAGVRRLVVLLNSRGDAVRGRLPFWGSGLEVLFLREDTASSWESFRLVSHVLAGEADRFMLSTVDTVVSPAGAERFGREALGAEDSAGLGLTRFVDDEKPLWADLGPDGCVEAIGPDARRRDCATCGFYALTAAAAGERPEASGFSRLRDYWVARVRSGKPVRGVLLEDAVDVDRPEDVASAERKAERWIGS
jgi:choline kinase